MWFLLPLVLLAACGTIPDNPPPPRRDPEDGKQPDPKAQRTQYESGCADAVSRLSRYEACDQSHNRRWVERDTTQADVYSEQSDATLSRLIQQKRCQVSCRWQTKPQDIENGIPYNQADCEVLLETTQSGQVMCGESRNRSSYDREACRVDSPTCAPGKFD